MKIFGLKHKTLGILGLSITSNDDAEFCNQTSVSLEKWYPGSPIFFVETFEKAQFVKENSTPWYNSTIEHPEHSFKSKDLKIFEVEVPD